MNPGRRLNLGCGPDVAAGWLNADREHLPGLDFRADLAVGLPLADGALDAIVAIHVLQDLALDTLPRAVAELHRVLAADGRLRLGLPDLDRAIDAYRRRDAGYFYVPDRDARRLGAKLVWQIVWYGSVRTPFTFDLAEELLEGAGFRDIVRCRFGETAGPWPELASRDNRERESLFVEARR
jgi:SAM-dependent methyltransferase